MTAAVAASEHHAAHLAYARKAQASVGAGAQHVDSSPNGAVTPYCDVFAAGDCLELCFIDPSGAECKPTPKADSELGKTLDRIVKTVNKKKASATWTAELYHLGAVSPIDPATLNVDAWLDTSCLQLRSTCGQRPHLLYQVRRDQPRISSPPQLPGLPLVGFPVAATGITHDHADDIDYEWSIDGAVLGSGVSYTPEAKDIGRLLEVTCTPWRRGPKGERIEGKAVNACCARPVHMLAPGASKYLDEALASTAAPPCDSRIRVVTYNILWGTPDSDVRKTSVKALQAAGRKEEAEALKVAPASSAKPISHVSELPVLPGAVEWREHIGLKELRGYNADIIALQEVRGGLWKAWQPSFEQDGLAGVRSSVELNGELVLLWRRCKLRLEADETWLISRLLDDEWNADLREALQKAPECEAVFAAQPHVAQVATFTHISTARRVVVVNAHLIMNGMAPHLRALQLCLALRRLQRLQRSTGDFDIVLCGDFNSRGHEPEFEGMFELLETGVLPESHFSFFTGRNVGRASDLCEESRRCKGIFDGKPCGRETVGTSGLCMDHLCVICNDFKVPRRPLCTKCADKGETPPKRSIPSGAFVCTMTQPIYPFESVCKRILGHMYYYHLAFKPQTGQDWPGGWGEMKDHILYSPGLRAVWMLPPPPPESLHGLPNLNWSSDHIAIVGDLEFVA
eukprot:TRINITY_DN90440_c0_g1_i1.p1 TRINITY_DN90440_c0_g1~~TRINITY_DN90440_c0_g1_i1.p1  ORF type:complete len:684 (+),score=79.45 TRINITY_DN90440_c0_g1_i1:60-2111(+)